MQQNSETRPKKSGRVRRRTEGGPTCLQRLGPNWALSASDLTFLARECPACLYRKVVQKRTRPRGPFPSVFGRVDGLMKAFYERPARGGLPDALREARLVATDRWVASTPVAPPGCSSSVSVQGRLDGLVQLTDGVFAVIDFKCIEPSEELADRYFPQLATYAWALAHPSRGTPYAVERLGLVCFSPERYEVETDRAVLAGASRWVEVPRDDERFLTVLSDVVGVLEGSEPAPDPNCPWCRYLGSAA